MFSSTSMWNRTVTSSLSVTVTCDMRNSSIMETKHIRRNCIGRYAANIKHALRVAYGRERYVPSPSQQGPSKESQRTQQYHQLHQHQHSQDQLRLLLSLLFPNPLPNKHVVTNSSDSESHWNVQRVTDSRALDVRNGCAT